MGHHLTGKGTFKSDKYDWCPEGYFALSFKDPLALQAINFYAVLTKDKELADDLLAACGQAESEMEPPA